MSRRLEHSGPEQGGRGLRSLGSAAAAGAAGAAGTPCPPAAAGRVGESKVLTPPTEPGVSLAEAGLCW